MSSSGRLPRLIVPIALMLAATSLTACGEDDPATPAAAPAPAAPAANDRPTAPPTGQAAKTPASPVAAGADAGKTAQNEAALTKDKGDRAADVGAPGEKAPKKRNAWGVPPAAPPVQAADRAYVLTRGKDRSYSDAEAIYQLYAYDVATVRKRSALLLELGGGTFEVPGEFLIRAGSSRKELRKGDMVLAEWASALKHAVITGFEGERAKIRYTDLPQSWAEDRITALKTPRELTLQKKGFSPGNFVIADIEGRRYIGLLIAESPAGWLVRRFSHRVVLLPRSKLTTMPLRPQLRRRQHVLAPWVGVMYRGRVRKVAGTRVLVQIEGIGQKAPVVASFGQVLPLAKQR